METRDYQDLAMRTAKMFPTMEQNMNHAALGISSEIGEFSLTVAQAWMKIPFIPANLAEELGDASWYCALACHHLGWRFEDMLLEPETVSDLSQELAVAVVNRNPIAMTLMAQFFAGEVTSGIKAFVIYGKPLDTDKLRPMLQLLVTTISLLCDIHAFSFEEVALRLNIEKLQKRYPDKYTDADALARADKVEQAH